MSDTASPSPSLPTNAASATPAAFSPPLSLMQGQTNLSEGPYWNADDRSLYFSDIHAGRLWRFTPESRSPAAGGRLEIFFEGDQPVGGFTRQQDGSWLLFRESDVLSVDARGQAGVSRPLRFAGARRCNDVVADNFGNVYVGTIGETPETGGLYRLGTDGGLSLVCLGTACSNGLAFSPAGDAMYWTDTTARTIYRFERNPESGTLGTRTVLYVCPEGEGIPDGLCTDAHGRLWSARWGGNCIVVISAEGQKLFSIPLEEANITSLNWGGEQLRDLYITTGRRDSKPGLHDLFVIENAGEGVAEFPSALAAGASLHPAPGAPGGMLLGL